MAAERLIKKCSNLFTKFNCAVVAIQSKTREGD